MDIILNDLSLEGQFYSAEQFSSALGRIMQMRELCRRFGLGVNLHRRVATRMATLELTVLEAVSRLSIDKQRSFMQWITRDGPFWDDDNKHDFGEYMECDGDIITESGLAEAAYRCNLKIRHDVVSVQPSTWEHSPLTVTWHLDNEQHHEISVTNYWLLADLETSLRAAPAQANSWAQLEIQCAERFTGLTFAPECFRKQVPEPFSHLVASRILERLDVLDRIRSGTDHAGVKSHDARRLEELHFKGDFPWFCDSSDPEKRQYGRALSFPHPRIPGQYIQCTWHGRIRQTERRIHFSWPLEADYPIYIAHVGPKITTR